MLQPKYLVNDLGLPNFVKGRVYTVTGFTDDEIYGPFIHVAELDPLCMGHVRGFRPIVEKKTSIAFAHEILNKVTRKHKEKA